MFIRLGNLRRCCFFSDTVDNQRLQKGSEKRAFHGTAGVWIVVCRRCNSLADFANGAHERRKPLGERNKQVIKSENGPEHGELVPGSSWEKAHSWSGCAKELCKILRFYGCFAGGHVFGVFGTGYYTSCCRQDVWCSIL